MSPEGHRPASLIYAVENSKGLCLEVQGEDLGLSRGPHKTYTCAHTPHIHRRSKLDCQGAPLVCDDDWIREHFQGSVSSSRLVR